MVRVSLSAHLVSPNLRKKATSSSRKPATEGSLPGTDGHTRVSTRTLLLNSSFCNDCNLRHIFIDIYLLKGQTEPLILLLHAKDLNEYSSLELSWFVLSDCPLLLFVTFNSSFFCLFGPPVHYRKHLTLMTLTFSFGFKFSLIALT